MRRRNPPGHLPPVDWEAPPPRGMKTYRRKPKGPGALPQDAALSPAGVDWTPRPPAPRPGPPRPRKSALRRKAGLPGKRPHNLPPPPFTPEACRKGHLARMAVTTPEFRSEMAHRAGTASAERKRRRRKDAR